MSHVTTFEDDKPIHRLLINLGVEVSNQKNEYSMHLSSIFTSRLDCNYH